MNWPEQFGGGAESSPSDWQTTTSSSLVIYPSIQEYVYVSRYARFWSAGTSSVKAPFSGSGHAITVIKQIIFKTKQCIYHSINKTLTEYGLLWHWLSQQNKHMTNRLYFVYSLLKLSYTIIFIINASIFGPFPK